MPSTQLPFTHWSLFVQEPPSASFG